MRNTTASALLTLISALFLAVTSENDTRGGRLRIKPRGDKFWRPLKGFVLFTCELYADNGTNQETDGDYEEFNYDDSYGPQDSNITGSRNNSLSDIENLNQNVSGILDDRVMGGGSNSSQRLMGRRRRQDWKDRRRERETLEQSSLHWLDKEGFEINPGTSETSLVYVENGAQEVGKISRKLYITHIQNHHAGFYTCFEQRNGQKTNLSAKVKLMLYREIQFEPGPEVVEGSVGRPLLIPCRALGTPTPTISWRFKDRTINTASESRLELSKDGLYIRSVNKSDEGSYICRAEVENSGNYREKIISVVIRSAPMFAVDMGVVYGIQGESLLIQCRAANGFPPPTYSFHRNDSLPMRAWTHELPEQRLDNIVVNGETGLVQFMMISKSDEGQYVCMAENEAGRAFSTLTLRVHNGPTITEFHSAREIRWMTATLMCKSEGSPAPNVTFYRVSKRDTSIRTFGPHRMSNMTELRKNYTTGWNENDRILVTTVYDGCATLYIKDLRPDDAGEYLCRTKNRFGFDEEIATVDVVYPPVTVDIKPSPVYIALGEKKNLSCSFEADPLPSREWRHDNETIKSNDTFSIYETDNSSVLEITMLKGSDSSWLYGYYTCILENVYGVTQLDIEVEGTRPPSVLDDVIVSRVTTSSVYLHLVPTLNESNLPIRGYQVQYDDVKLVFSPNTSLVLNTLRPSTTYILHVRAVNEYGEGDDYKLFFTTHHLDVPFPVIVTSQNQSTSSSSYLVTWDIPDDGGRPILRYEIRYRTVIFFNDSYLQPLTSWRYRVIVVKSSEPVKNCRLTDLSRNSLYQLEIRAENEFGWSNYTESFYFVTMKDDRHQFDPELYALLLNSAQSHHQMASHITVILSLIVLSLSPCLTFHNFNYFLLFMCFTSRRET